MQASSKRENAPTGSAAAKSIEIVYIYYYVSITCNMYEGNN